MVLGGGKVAGVAGTSLSMMKVCVATSLSYVVLRDKIRFSSVQVARRAKEDRRPK